jgi:energy-coupling factor transporter ATP-binding protein EcfA2
VARVFPAATRPLAGADEVWTLREARDSWLVEPPGLPVERFATLSHALDAIELLVASRLLALQAEIPQLHAAGAVPRGEAVLAIGRSGAGKSSIALHWSQAGIPVLGDDAVLLAERARALAFPRLFSVDRARLASAGTTADPALQWGPPDDEVRYDPASGGGWAPAAPVGLIAFIERRPQGPPVAERLPKSLALSLLAGALLPTGCGPDRCFDLLLGVAERAHAVRLTFSDSGEAARELVALTA